MHPELSPLAASFRFEELSNTHGRHGRGADLDRRFFRRQRTTRRSRGRPLAPVVALPPQPAVSDVLRDDQRIA